MPVLDPTADSPDPDVAPALREVLESAGFSAAGVRELVGEEALAAATGPADDRSAALRATEGGDALSTLVRLFLLGAEVDGARASAALRPLSLEAAVATGILRPAGGSSAAAGGAFAATLRLTPLVLRGVDLVVAHDPPGHLQRRDEVIGVGPSSADLAELTIEQRSTRALDLGCGGGVQAILLAARSEQVVASDVNERALAYCGLNAELNRARNIERRLGDRFDPVRDERFDLIVCNPPFVVSPDDALLYRDGGLPLDEMARSVIRGAAAHLAPLGYAQVLASWPLRRGEAWHERLHGWVEGLGCDAWAVQDERQSADAYARRWLSHGGQVDPASYARWLDSYEREGIEGFGYGLVTLRRVEHRSPWWRHDELPALLAGRPADGLHAGFEAADWLAGHGSDAALLDARLHVSPGTRLESWQHAEGGRWKVERAVLRQVEGLAFSGLVNDEVAALVAGCDGRRPLREVLEALRAEGEAAAPREVLAT
ncbi:MAG TPA: methyltransferase, partial [Acidimicrobiales bacterium]|nr:methyltransferase [Acidimicrobiales bacterium]